MMYPHSVRPIQSWKNTVDWCARKTL